MIDEKTRNARETFKTFCETLEEKELSYQPSEEELGVSCTLVWEGVPLTLDVHFETDTQLVLIESLFPFPVPAEREKQMSLAVCTLNKMVIDSFFVYDAKTGSVAFRLAHSYKKSIFTEKTFDYLLLCSFSTIVEYGEYLDGLSTGSMSLDEFIEVVTK